MIYPHTLPISLLVYLAILELIYIYMHKIKKITLTIIAINRIESDSLIIFVCFYAISIC